MNMKKNKFGPKDPKFKKYIYATWFLKSIEISWKLTRNSSIARLASERAGEKIFDEFCETKKWSAEDWVNEVKKSIHEPLGSEVEFQTNEKRVFMYLKKCPFENVMKMDKYATCSFHYGMWRGMFRKAFSNGELLLEKVISKCAPQCEFLFILDATEDDRMHAMENRRKLFTK